MLKELAQIEARTRDDSASAQHGRDQDSPDSAISIPEWTHGLELGMGDRNLHQRENIVQIHIALPSGHCALKMVGRDERAPGLVRVTRHLVGAPPFD